MVFNALIYILIVYGIATIISSEYIFSGLIDKFEKYTTLYTLLTCNKCLSIYVGFIISLFGYGIITPLLDPFIAYTVTVIMNKFLDK